MHTPAPAQNPAWEWIDDSSGMQRVAAAAGAADRVYLDLEADSMHHYFAKICLIQVLAGGSCFLVDPLAGADIAPLLTALAEKPLVLHGADYDLRMLHRQHGFRPREIYDTMIAAQLLGRKAFGLAALVQEISGVVIGKEGQKADWSQRPLPRPLLEYAALDTAYLPNLREIQLRELKEKDRIAWHRESCESLVKATERIREVDPDMAWRVSGSSRFAPRQLAALKAMWEVRENLGRKSDLPPYRILPSDIMLRFAEAVPWEGNPERIPKMPSRLDPEARAAFLDAFDRSLLLPRERCPQPLPPPPKPAKSPHPDLVADIRAIRDGIAAKLALDPSLLAPKAVMLSVALTGLTSAESARAAAAWMPWQEDLLLGPWLEAGDRHRKVH